MNANPVAPHARRIGALAGLAPALAALVVLIILGASPTGDTAEWYAGIAVVAIGDGWLIGPRTTSSFPSDLWTAVAYAVVGSLVYLVVGTAISIWAGPAIEGNLVPDLAGRVAGQLVYGLLYLPFLAGVLTPFGLIWVVTVRMIRRRSGIPTPATAARTARRLRFGRGLDPRRMALFAAVLIVAFGVFVAVLPLLLYDEPRSPWWVYRPAALFVLFSVPAAIAVIGGLWRRRSLLVTAGVICLAQAYVSFSLVTVGFLVPAILLLVLGAGERLPGFTPEPRRAGWIAGFAVIALTVAAWVAVLGMTEPRCWRGEQAADGTVMIIEVPTSDAELNGPTAVTSGGSGCSSAELTIPGMRVGAIFAIGAVVMAAASTVGGSKDDAT